MDNEGVELVESVESPASTEPVELEDAEEPVESAEFEGEILDGVGDAADRRGILVHLRPL